MNKMDSAPLDGTRVILKYTTLGFSHKTQDYRPTGQKWEECRWIDNKDDTGSDPHWEPWCGHEREHTTLHIAMCHAIGWLPTPEDEI